MNINKVCAAWRLVKQLSLLRAAGAAGCNRSSNDPIPIFQTPASDRLRLSSLFGGTILAPQDAIDHAAKYPIGKYGENRAYHQRFERIDPALDDDLVDHVDNDRQNVDPANVLPGFKQQGSPVCRIFQNRPEIQRSACSGVRPPGADSIEKGDERLKNQAEPKWRMHAARYVAPCAYEGVKQVGRCFRRMCRWLQDNEFIRRFLHRSEPGVWGRSDRNRVVQRRWSVHSHSEQDTDAHSDQNGDADGDQNAK